MAVMWLLAAGADRHQPRGSFFGEAPEFRIIQFRAANVRTIFKR